MEIKGFVIELGDVRGGTSARTGNKWRRQPIVLETSEQYPKHLVFDIAKEELFALDIKVGEELVVKFGIDASKNGDRWWNSVTAWSIEKTGKVIVMNG